MSTPRLTFLYPHLFIPRTFRKPIASPSLHSKSSPHSGKAQFSTTAPRKEETYAQRYGSAADIQLPPPSQPPVSNDLGRDKTLADAIEKEVKGPTSQKPEEKKADQAPPPKEASKPPPNGSKEASTTPQPPIGDKARNLDASESHPLETLRNAATQGDPSTHPLSTVLSREEPTAATPEEHKPPHLQAPRYIHHFDTYTLVKDLQKGEFTEDQSVTLMKAVRMLLAQNLDVAREGLVSKSDIENVRPYPFPSLHSFSPFPTPQSRNPIHSTQLTPHPRHTGNLPLPRRLLRAAHRNHQRPPPQLPKIFHAALAPHARNLAPLPTPHPRSIRFERRSSRHAQRPPHGRAHGAAGHGPGHPGTQLQDHRLADEREQERGGGAAVGADKEGGHGDCVYGRFDLGESAVFDISDPFEGAG